MEKFDEVFAAKIALGCKKTLEDWIVEMDHKMRYTENTQAETNALKRRMRIVRDYITFHCKCDGDGEDEPKRSDP